MFRVYAPGDENQIRTLRERVFGSTLALQDWRWRTFENPAGTALIIIAQEKIGGRIVGHIGTIATDLKVGDFLRKGFFLADFAVDRSYRGRGIHAALIFILSAKCCEQDGGFGCGLPNEQAYPPLLNGGSIHILTMRLFFKVLDWSKIFLSRLHAGFPAKEGAHFLWPFRKRRPAISRNGFKVEEIGQFGGEVNELWRAISHRFAIAAVKDADHLNWRYFARPNSSYRVLAVSQAGKWKGYIVTTMLEKWGLPLGTIVDLFFDPDCPAAGELLLQHAEANLRNNGAAALWGLFAFPETYRKLFRKAGFFKAPQLKSLRQFHFVADFVTIECFRPDLNERDGALLRRGDQWFFSLGDTDLA